MIHSIRKKIGSNFYIGENSTVECNSFVVGDNCYIGDNVHIRCHNFVAGNFLFVKDNAEIGHGGSNGISSDLRMGNGCFIGSRATINVARGITMGNEVGIGDDVKLFTHGVYLNVLDGFPSKFDGIEIGNNVWIQSMAHVMPGVTINDNSVILAGSIVTRDVPNGSLVGGNPAKVIKENEYPKSLSTQEKESIITHLVRQWVDEFNAIKSVVSNIGDKVELLKIYHTSDGLLGLLFTEFTVILDYKNRDYFECRKPEYSEIAEDLRDYLRRHGIRIMTANHFKSIDPYWVKSK